MTSTKTFLIASIASLACLSTFPSAASDVTLHVKAYELETAGGIANLYTRIVDRADAACTQTGRRGIYAMKAEKECAASLAESFVANIGNDRLTRHAAQVGQQRYALKK